MRKKRIPAVKAKPPRNPFARALGAGGLFKPKVVKSRDAYVRKPRHRKPLKHEVDASEE